MAEIQDKMMQLRNEFEQSKAGQKYKVSGDKLQASISKLDNEIAELNKTKRAKKRELKSLADKHTSAQNNYIVSRLMNATEEMNANEEQS